jgi:hypothetical protein
LPERRKVKLMVEILAKGMGKPEAQVYGIAYYRLGKIMKTDVRLKAEQAGVATLLWIEDQQRIGLLKRVLKSMHDEMKTPRRKRP